MDKNTTCIDIDNLFSDDDELGKRVDIEKAIASILEQYIKEKEKFLTNVFTDACVDVENKEEMDLVTMTLLPDQVEEYRIRGKVVVTLYEATTVVEEKNGKIYVRLKQDAKVW